MSERDIALKCADVAGRANRARYAALIGGKKNKECWIAGVDSR